MERIVSETVDIEGNYNQTAVGTRPEVSVGWGGGNRLRQPQCPTGTYVIHP